MSLSNPPRPPDWQLPVGVDRALWDYTHSTSLAEGYDEANADAPILVEDIPFVIDNLPPCSEVIDLGCGSGRVLVELARRGHAMTGVDLSAPMLSICKKKLMEDGLEARLVEGNICDLSSHGLPLFDAALLMFSTLGMVVGCEERERVLRETHRLLKENGMLILHVHSRWSQRYSSQGRRWLAWDLVRSIWQSRGSGDVVQPAVRGIRGLRMHLFWMGEMKTLLSRAGFRELTFRAVGHSPGTSVHQASVLRFLLADGWLIAARKVSSSP